MGPCYNENILTVIKHFIHVILNFREISADMVKFHGKLTLSVTRRSGVVYGLQSMYTQLGASECT
jgi:hypothetical protein